MPLFLRYELRIGFRKAASRHGPQGVLVVRTRALVEFQFLKAAGRDRQRWLDFALRWGTVVQCGVLTAVTPSLKIELVEAPLKTATNRG
jgi:hypothetical protein